MKLRQNLGKNQFLMLLNEYYQNLDKIYAKIR